MYVLQEFVCSSVNSAVDCRASYIHYSSTLFSEALSLVDNIEINFQRL